VFKLTLNAGCMEDIVKFCVYLVTNSNRVIIGNTLFSLMDFPGNILGTSYGGRCLLTDDHGHEDAWFTYYNDAF